MNLLLGTVRSNQLCNKCFLLPYSEKSVHKAIKICSQFDYFVSVKLSASLLHRLTVTVKEDL